MTRQGDISSAAGSSAAGLAAGRTARHKSGLACGSWCPASLHIKWQETAGARWGNRGSPTQLGPAPGPYGTETRRAPASDPQSILLARHPRKNAGFARGRKGGALRELSRSPGALLAPAAGSSAMAGTEPRACTSRRSGLALPPSRQAAPSCSAHPRRGGTRPARLLPRRRGFQQRLPLASGPALLSRPRPHSPGPAPSSHRPASLATARSPPGAAPVRPRPVPPPPGAGMLSPRAGKSAGGSAYKSPFSGLGGKGKGLEPGGIYLLGRSGLHAGNTFSSFSLVLLHTFFFFFHLLSCLSS